MGGGASHSPSRILLTIHICGLPLPVLKGPPFGPVHFIITDSTLYQNPTASSSPMNSFMYIHTTRCRAATTPPLNSGGGYAFANPSNAHFRRRIWCTTEKKNVGAIGVLGAIPVVKTISVVETIDVEAIGVVET